MSETTTGPATGPAAEPSGEPDFRTATLADVPALVALVESAYRGETSKAGWTSEADLLGGQRTDAEAVAEAVGHADGLVLLAERDGELLACCQLERRGDRAYFGMFSVRPGLQGGGIGRAVLARAERLAGEEWGVGVMEMTVIEQRSELIAWYERRGFRRTGEYSPFPYGDERFGIPRRPDLRFERLIKELKAV
ncbi:GNAT family N-acetyltransferase [Kitasatospora sp. NPDC127059]|uniref:GNAT family N-acetyltransferase n=1 Tax=unclassified Kitasatospora TaxID=2633591 RepID=UPI003665808F